ncbi:5659_t:CDS:10 [Ambispora gerdemannii]|uniref:5659_t:CDS:1 n=1 Tax=Ambispora gerdemannii TaxID=144530 RepID=A0A9N8YQR2_9GLOM|nr:5659_t:CDS:10 [Ambispora gerdemannii]
MPLPKSNKNAGLGRAIIRDRFKGNTRPRDGDTTLHTTNLDDGPSWTKLRSITQERDLDEFLTTAQLAGTNFTAEKLNITVVKNTYRNPFLLDAEKERETLKRHAENKDKLTIPRRPKWDKTTTTEQLERNEKDAFLKWRRELAYLQEQEEFLLTPFEKNLEVWRQLWRVIERSQLVVQIVDARNPLFFRSTDLEKYVKEVDLNKKNILLVNKADLLTDKQRQIWADYFESQNIKYIFFSATLAQVENLEDEQTKELDDESIEKESLKTENESEDEESEANVVDSEQIVSQGISTTSIFTTKIPINKDDVLDVLQTSLPILEDEVSTKVEIDNSMGRLNINQENILIVNENDIPLQPLKDERIQIRTTSDLLSLLDAETNELEGFVQGAPQKLTIGLVGYPNVGKSSTINALLGQKRVSVSSTPGKTKHFQTIQLSSTLTLCDCPGLVFPNFATTNADMVCNGVLPIDQLREFTGPAALIAQRIPRKVLEAIYGITIRTKSADEGGDGVPTAEELLTAYAVARGFTKAGFGEPDESRAARYILKDYVNGRIPFCHPPDTISAREFNAELHDIERFLKPKKKAADTNIEKESDISSLKTSLSTSDNGSITDIVSMTGEKSRALDKSFFNKPSTSGSVQIKGSKFASFGSNNDNFHRVNIYQIHGKIADDGTLVETKDGSSSQFSLAQNLLLSPAIGKKHHKKGKKNIKNRRKIGYE